MTVRGMIHASLAQRIGGSLRKLRVALQAELASVRIVNGAPPGPDDPRAVHRRHLLDLLMPDTLAGRL